MQGTMPGPEGSPGKKEILPFPKEARPCIQMNVRQGGEHGCEHRAARECFKGSGEGGIRGEDFRPKGHLW